MGGRGDGSASDWAGRLAARSACSGRDPAATASDRQTDGRWYTIHVAYGWTRIDIHLIERSSGTRTTVIEGEQAVTGLQVIDERLIGSTTLGADRGRVVAAPLATPTSEHWDTLVPESEAVIEGVAITPGSLIVASTLRATSRLVRYDHDGSGGEPIELPELGSIGGLSASDDEELAAFSFTGFARPATCSAGDPTTLAPSCGSGASCREHSPARRATRSSR